MKQLNKCALGFERVTPRYSANTKTKKELRRESKRRKIVYLTLKYHKRILCMEKENVVRICYDYQKIILRLIVGLGD